MTFITATHTLSSIEALNRRTILERFLRDSGFGDYGTATGGSTSAIVDTTLLKSTQFPDDYWNGAWARISYDGGGSGVAPEGEVSPITDYVASTGTLTVNPVYSAAVASTDKYQLWRFIHPQRALDTLDTILKEEVYLPDWTLLTECPDGDMEQNNTTDWGTSNASVAKQTGEPSLWGRRWLRVTTTAAGGYAQNTAAIAVVPGVVYHVSVIARPTAASTTATLRAYDNTNGDTIDLKTYAGRAAGRMHTEITIPSGCYDLRLRLGATQDAVSVDFDELCVYSIEATSLSLPWWVKNKAQVKGIFRPSFESIEADVWDPWPTMIVDAGRWDFRPAGFGGNRTSISRRDRRALEPVYIYGTRNEVAFANESTEEKRVDGNFINAALLYHSFRQMLVQPNAGLQNLDWVKDVFKLWEKEYTREKRKQEERVADAIQSAMPDIYVSGHNTNWSYWDALSQVI